MNKKLVSVVFSLIAFSFSSVSFAADAEAGKAKAGVCAGCHGPDGISFAGMYPNIKGQKAAYTLKQLKAFKSGDRKDPIMAGMVAPLSDADMENLAAYYAGLK